MSPTLMMTQNRIISVENRDHNGSLERARPYIVKNVPQKLSIYKKNNKFFIYKIQIHNNNHSNHSHYYNNHKNNEFSKKLV